MRKVRFNPIERTKLAKRTPSSRDGTRALKHFFSKYRYPVSSFLKVKPCLRYMSIAFVRVESVLRNTPEQFFFSKIESSPEELFSVAFTPEGFFKINTPDFAPISAEFSDACCTYDFAVDDPYEKRASTSKIITIYVIEVSIF